MKIVIDAGHNDSGWDTGANGNGLREQDITFDVAVLAGEELKRRGVAVMYTRNNKTDNLGTNLSTSLEKRCKIANDWKADWFISLHCNAGGGVGAETWVYKLGGQAEGLARNIQNALVAFGMKDRGVKVRPELYVLKNTNMASALVELGFIDSANDSQVFMFKKNELAMAVANGVCKFIGIGVINMSNVSEWAKESVQKAVDKGILKGDENGNLRPQDGVTREELCVILDRCKLL